MGIVDNNKFLEKLHDFARLCNETNGGSFSLTKNVRSRKWKLHFINKGTSFENEDIQELIKEASLWIVEERMPIENEVKFTLFTK